MQRRRQTGRAMHFGSNFNVSCRGCSSGLPPASHLAFSGPESVFGLTQDLPVCVHIFQPRWILAQGFLGTWQALQGLCCVWPLPSLAPEECLCTCEVQEFPLTSRLRKLCFLYLSSNQESAPCCSCHNLYLKVSVPWDRFQLLSLRSVSLLPPRERDISVTRNPSVGPRRSWEGAMPGRNEDLYLVESAALNSGGTRPARSGERSPRKQNLKCYKGAERPRERGGRRPRRREKGEKDGVAGDPEGGAETQRKKEVGQRTHKMCSHKHLSSLSEHPESPVVL